MKIICDAQPRLRKYFRCAVLLGALLLPISTPALAQSVQSAVFVVGNDRGGIIGNRAKEIERLKSAGKRVEIRGRICLSSCTMYLGAGDVCVKPDTRFGFHGPSYYGRPLQKVHFDYWSEVLASHYPPAIKAWFMSDARHTKKGYHTVLGAELIRHGVPAC